MTPDRVRRPATRRRCSTTPGRLPSAPTPPRPAPPLLAVVCLFGVFASNQFHRGQSSRLLLVALTLGVMIDVVGLIALPLYQANEIDEVALQIRKIDHPDVEVAIPSYAERLEAGGG